MIYVKDPEGIQDEPDQHFSFVPSVAWWTAFGSRSVEDESLGQSKSLKQDRGSVPPFTVLSGDFKDSMNLQKPQVAISAPPEDHSCIELGFAQPMICTKVEYSNTEPCYGIFSAYGPQISGRVMLPLNLSAIDGPTYVNVNPKQYNGIIRRRKSREKAKQENRLPRIRKPYMHESRHLHAKRRARGCGGRFLNSKTSNNDEAKVENEKKNGGTQLKQQSWYSGSEVLQSESGNLNSSQETNDGRISHSGCEVTSMYSNRSFNHSPFRDISVPGNKGISAARDPRNLKV